jgi:hypothetical protein
MVGQSSGRAGQRAVAPLGQGDGATERRRGERDAHQRPVGRQRDGGHHGGAEPGRHEGEDARHLSPLADEMRLDPRRLAGRQRHRAQVVALPEHHQVEPVEIAHPDAPAAGERVVGRGGQHERVVEERRGRHQRVGHREHHEGQVDLARRDLGHQLVRARLHHRQVDAGVAGMEGHQGRGQCAGDEARRRPDRQRPRAMPDSARASAPVASTSASTRCMKGRRTAPSGVRVTGPCPGPRLKSRTPARSRTGGPGATAKAGPGADGRPPA